MLSDIECCLLDAFQVLLSGASFDDPSVAPVVRQTLLHWAYALSERDFHLGSRRVKRNGATYIPRSLMQEKVGTTFSQPNRDASSDLESKSGSKKRSTQDRNARALKRSRAE
jgi:hypothetical protein